MPAPSDRFYELEAMREYGGPLVWELLSEERKAELIAHEFERSMRREYASEMFGEEEGRGVSQEQSYGALRARFGLPG